MGRGREGAACHIDQEFRSGPNPDPRHAGQDRMKRVRKHKALDFFRHYPRVVRSQRRQLLRQARQDDAGGLSAREPRPSAQ